MQRVEGLVKDWQEGVPPGLILLTMAIVPAVFEELFFRGYLFTALRAATTATRAIVASAVIFGVFHVCATSALATERFVPSTLLGLMLGWICWRTKSILPGMLLHACHNSLILMMAFYRDELQRQLALWGWALEDQSHLPLSWLAVACVGVIIGTAMIFWASHRRAAPARS
jgi:ABC-2 type transport system permease protein/sodium transport system permease protein